MIGIDVAYKIMQSTKLGKKKMGRKSLSCYRAQFPKQFAGKLSAPSKLSVVVFPSVKEMSRQALVRVLLWLLYLNMSMKCLAGFCSVWF